MHSDRKRAPIKVHAYPSAFEKMSQCCECLYAIADDLDNGEHGMDKIAAGTPYIQYQKVSGGMTSTELSVKRRANSTGTEVPCRPVVALDRCVGAPSRMTRFPESYRRKAGT